MAAPLPRPGTLHPATGQPLAPVAWTTPAEVIAIVAKARSAQPAWAARPLSERIAAVQAFANRVVERRAEIVPILAEETGRTDAESLLTEVSILANYAKGAAAVARKALAPEKVRLSPLEFPGKKVVIEAVPRGVVGIIEPWNFPLLQFYKPLFPALFAGNAVVLKPSEHTPRSGRWLAEQAQGVLPEGVVGLILGDGEVGAALVEARIDALVFTGSTRVGKKVAARCAERLLPCSVELGGKDAALVLADCDLDRTVAGLAFGAMGNAGQDCSGVERIYVEEAIADRFVGKLAAVCKALRVNDGSGGADIGPLQNGMQLAIVQEHVKDAIAKGARVVAGGEATGKGNGFQATVLDECSPDMLVVREETFGPVVAVTRVKNAEEALRLANDSPYGLGGSVWTTDLARGEALARRMDVGLALVNNHKFAGVVPQIPWTGTKESGTGIAASLHTYPTFVRRRTIIVDKNKNPEPFWFPGDSNLLSLANNLADFQLGAFTKLFGLLGTLSKRVAAVKELVSKA